MKHSLSSLANVIAAVLLFLSFGNGYGQYPVSPNLQDEKGQRTGHWTIWYDSAWNEVHHIDSVIYYRLIRFENGKPSGKVRDFYKTGLKQWDGFLLTINPDVFDGESNFYHENGKLSFKQNNVNGVLEGPSTEYAAMGYRVAKGQYKAGKADGKWLYFFPDGGVELELMFKDGEANGPRVNYYSNGKIVSKGVYLNNKQQGKWENFYETGTRRSLSNYNQGKLQGVRELYHENGMLNEKGIYIDGEGNGPWASFYSDGKPEYTGAYLHDRKEGNWVYYYTNGNVQKKGRWHNDLSEGVWEYFHENGQLSSKGSFREGHYEGDWITYHTNGVVSDMTPYTRDTINGTVTNYHDNGKTKSEGKKIMGLSEGPWKFYHENGMLSAEGGNHLGAREGVWKYYNAEGVVEDLETYQGGKLHGEVISYYPNGQVKSQTQYLDGKGEGPFHGYYDTGSRRSEGNFLLTQKDGEWTWYWENGQIQTRTNYKKDTVQGTSTDYFASGIKSAEMVYKDGVKQGIAYWYYQNGALKQSGGYQEGLAFGPWSRLDSVTHQVIEEGKLVSNKYDGVWVAYDEKGKVKTREYYILGFHETRDNIQDSIQRLIDRQHYDMALRAVDWMEKVTKRDNPSRSSRTLPIHMRGKIYSGMGNYKAALEWNLQYLKEIKKYEGMVSDNYKNAVHNVATAYHGLKQYEEALRYYDEAIGLAQPQGLVQSYWSSVNNKAYCLYDAGKPEAASKMFEDELKKSEALYGPDSSAGWYLRHEAAEYYYDRPDDYDRSFTLFRDLLDDILASKPDNLYAFDCYRRLAYITDVVRQGDIASIPYYREGIAFAERNKLTDLPEYPELVADLYYVFQNYYETDSVMAKGYEETIHKLIALPPVNSNTQARIWQTIGNYYNDHKDYKQALSFFLQSMGALLKAGQANTPRHADILNNIAFAQLNADRLERDKAESYILEAVEIRKRKAVSSPVPYIKARLSLAQFYSSAGKRNQSIALLQELIPSLADAKDSVNLALAEFSLGKGYDQKGQYREALIHYEKAKPFYLHNQKRDANMAYNVIGYMADCYKYLNDYQQAKDYAEKAVTIAEKYFGTGSQTHLYSQTVVGDIHEYNGVHSEALRLYKLVAEGFEKLYGRTNIEYLFTEYKITKVYYAMGEYRKAVELGEGQLKWIEQNFSRVNDRYLDQLYILGDTWRELNDFTAAEKYKTAAVEISGKLYGVSHSTYAFYKLELGKFYKQQNRLEEAEQMLTEAVTLMRTTDYTGTSLATSYLIALAQVKNERDKNKEAEALFMEAFDITHTDSVNSPTKYVDAGVELAGFYSKVGRYGDCEKVILRITRFIELSDGKKFYYARVRAPLVNTYYGLSRYDEAEKEALELLQIAEEEGGSEHWLVMSLRNDLGILAEDRKDFGKAAEQYQFCIDALRRKGSLSAIEQYNLSVYYGNLANAELCLAQYTRANEHLALADQIQLKSGQEVSQKAKIGRQAKWAGYYRATGQFERAETAWSGVTKSLLQYTGENFYFMSDEEKAQFWKDVSGYFRTFHSFATQRARQNPAMVGEMYNIQLATKAILLNASNKIKKRILTSGDTAMVNTYYRWTHQREQLSKLYTLPGNTKNKQGRIDSLKVSVNALEKEMNITAEDMTQDKGGSRITWNQVQSTLGPQEAAVEIVRFRYYERYVRDSVIYAALVLTAETKLAPELVLLTDGKKLEGRALQFYKNAISAQLKDTVSYGNFWSPIAKAVKGKSRLYLSLDGVYNQINLNTLMGPNGNFLVSEANLTLLSNTKDLMAIKGRRVKRLSFSTATLFGFPTFFIGKDKMKEMEPARQRDFSDTDMTGIAPLAGTQEEIQKVEDILHHHRLSTFAFTDEHATEAELKKVDHPRVLHIATHGFFVDEKSPMFSGGDQNPLLRSGLLLTGASNFLQNHVEIDNENGILTAYEAANLDLDNTDLVVLSACETGRGEVQNGEGVYGLQRAFQTAGVQSIIMSLWKVDDTATQQLMTSFYTNWMGGMTKAEALKAAQLSLSQQYPHPYYWGAFVMLEN